MVNGLVNQCLKKGIRTISQRQIILDVIKGSESHPVVCQLHRHEIVHD